MRASPHRRLTVAVDRGGVIVNLALIPELRSFPDSRTGEVRYQQRLGAGSYSASPVFAEGRLYCLSEEGVTTVVASGPEFTRLAVNRVDGATLASMAVVDRGLILRTDRFLYRVGE